MSSTSTPHTPRLLSGANSVENLSSKEIADRLLEVYEHNQIVHESLGAMKKYYGGVMKTDIADALRKTRIEDVYVGRSSEEVEQLRTKYLLEVLQSENKRLMKDMKRKEKRHGRKVERLNSQYQCHVECVKEIKRGEESFLRNLHNLMDEKTYSVSQDKVMKYFKEELAMLDNTMYKMNFQVVELKKKLKKQSVREIQNTQIKTFTKVDFEQLEIENNEMRDNLKGINHEIVQFKKQIVKLKQLKTSMLESLGDIMKTHTEVVKRTERKERVIKETKRKVIRVEREKLRYQKRNKRVVGDHNNVKAPGTMKYILVIRDLSHVKKKLTSWSRKHEIVQNDRKLHLSRLRGVRRFFGRSKRENKTRPLSAGFSHLSLLERAHTASSSGTGRTRISNRPLSSQKSGLYTPTRSTYSYKTQHSYKTNRTS